MGDPLLRLVHWLGLVPERPEPVNPSTESRLESLEDETKGARLRLDAIELMLKARAAHPTAGLDLRRPEQRRHEHGTRHSS
jgi:hypothetical protein